MSPRPFLDAAPLPALCHTTAAVSVPLPRTLPVGLQALKLPETRVYQVCAANTGSKTAVHLSAILSAFFLPSWLRSHSALPPMDEQMLLDVDKF